MTESNGVGRLTRIITERDLLVRAKPISFEMHAGEL